MIATTLLDRVVNPAMDARADAVARQIGSGLPEATLARDAGIIRIQAPGLFADEFGTRASPGRSRLRSTLELIRKDTR